MGSEIRHSLEHLMGCLRKQPSPAPKQESRGGLAMMSASGFAIG